MSHAPKAKQSHRDGKFSDVIENPEHHQHPKTDFNYPHELPDEALAWEMTRAVSALTTEHSAKGVRLTREAILFQLRKVAELLSQYFPEFQTAVSAEAPLQQIELSEIFNFIWNAGEDGVAQARPDAALMRCGVVSWFFLPQLFDHATQKDFGMLLRDCAMVRCPNCVARKRAMETAAKEAKSDEDRRAWRARIREMPTHYLTTEMKKQSPNRIVTEMRDRWPGIKNGHMRSEVARENFRDREAAKVAHGRNKEAR